MGKPKVPQPSYITPGDHCGDERALLTLPVHGSVAHMLPVCTEPTDAPPSTTAPSGPTEAANALPPTYGPIRHWGIDYVLVIVKGALKIFVYSSSNMFGLRSRGWCNIEHASNISLRVVAVVIVGLSKSKQLRCWGPRLGCQGQLRVFVRKGGPLMKMTRG
ncbi:hypothetical protein BGY98DRAFT_210935 [Russula aff. rugulosa BPL654]|nr:hypothetical protein BGY98DRAFT_210935 [Russula aff. rugulosa BPL654]